MLVLEFMLIPQVSAKLKVRHAAWTDTWPLVLGMNLLFIIKTICKDYFNLHCSIRFDLLDSFFNSSYMVLFIIHFP